jgi:mRNA interferase MazF
VEREARKRRPTVVLSMLALAERHGLLWVVMVTSAAGRSWPEDVPIDDLAMAGLPKPSVIRACKLATVEGHRCERLGRLRPETAMVVAAMLEATVALRV